MLSKNFSIEEFTTSSRALSLGIDNTPPQKAIKSIENLVKAVLQPVREFTGLVITVTSGYRCKELNAKIGGASGSQHEKGEAADLVCNDNARLFNAIKQRGMFDQLIWEFGDNNQPEWVHVSYVDEKNRCEVLRATHELGEKGKTKVVYKQW